MLAKIQPYSDQPFNNQIKELLLAKKASWILSLVPDVLAVDSPFTQLCLLQECNETLGFVVVGFVRKGGWGMGP